MNTNMFRFIAFFGLILSFNPTKAKADPTWSNWAMCPPETWAIGFTISKATFSNTADTFRSINGLKLECADLDRSAGSAISANPLEGRAGLNWLTSIYTSNVLDFITSIEFGLFTPPFPSHRREPVSFLYENRKIAISSNLENYEHRFDLECSPGEALNGLMVESDENYLRSVKISCSNYQLVIFAKNIALEETQKVNRLEVLKQYATLEEVSLQNDIKSASIHKISFETLNSNISGAACAIADVSTNGFSSQTEISSFVDLFSKTFGHIDWQSNALSCDATAQSIASYTGCTDGSLDPICLNRNGYLEIKSRLEKKLGDYAKYRDEANAIGNGNVCLSIERLSQQALIDVGSDLSAKTAAGAFSGTCTGHIAFTRTPIAETFTRNGIPLFPKQ